MHGGENREDGMTRMHPRIYSPQAILRGTPRYPAVKPARAGNRDASRKGGHTIRWSILVPALVLLSFAILALPASASEDGMPAIVTNYTVSPPVLMPGESGAITIVIQQVGDLSISEKISTGKDSYIATKWSDPVNIEHISMEGNGLEVTSPEYDRVGRIGPKNSLRATFMVKAPVESGIYYPEIWIATDAGRSRFPVPVNVNTPVSTQKQAAIIMQSSCPQSVSVGDEIPVRITLRNEGGTLADRVILRLGNSSRGIAPKTSDTFSVGRLMPAEEKSLDLALLSDDDAAPGLASVPVSLRYTLIDGTARNENTSVNLILKGAGEMKFASLGTNPKRVEENQPFDITLVIDNAGSGRADDIEAAIDLPVAGTKQAYIGKMMPGDEAPAVFMMNGAKEGTYTYNTSVSYTDDSGTHRKVRQQTLRISPRDPAPLYLFLLLALLATGTALGIAFWLRRGNGKRTSAMDEGEGENLTSPAAERTREDPDR